MGTVLYPCITCMGILIVNAHGTCHAHGKGNCMPLEAVGGAQNRPTINLDSMFLLFISVYSFEPPDCFILFKDAEGIFAVRFGIVD